MSAPEPDDTALLGRVVHGDQAAFAELYDRHSSAVLGLLVRMVGAKPEAEEILQEVFLQLWREADRYRPDAAPPRTWLLMMARSRALDRLRSVIARGRRETSAARDEACTGSAVGPTGPERLDQRERRDRVMAALRVLPDEQRRAIEHAFFGGLTHREIAELLGHPLGTVKSRILLGMRKLREVLEAP